MRARATSVVTETSRGGLTVHPRATYVASVWAFAFAGVTFYWAAGGTVGASTVGNAVTSLATSDWGLFSAVLLVDGSSKVLLGLLALALVRPWGRWLPDQFLLFMS